MNCHLCGIPDCAVAEKGTGSSVDGDMVAMITQKVIEALNK